MQTPKFAMDLGVCFELRTKKALRIFGDKTCLRIVHLPDGASLNAMHRRPKHVSAIAHQAGTSHDVNRSPTDQESEIAPKNPIPSASITAIQPSRKSHHQNIVAASYPM